MIHTIVPTVLLAALLSIATFVDIRTMRIPDALNAALVASGLAVTWLLGKPLLAALVGAAVGYLALFLLNWAYRRARGRDGLGLGDAKLLAGAGAWLGWMGLPFVVLIASALGLAWVAGARVAGRRLQAHDALAFGPFICAGTFVVWLVQTFR